MVATLHHYQHFDHHLYPILLDHQLNPHTLRHCVPFFFLFCFIFFFLTLFFYFSFSFLFFLGESATELINTSGSPQSPVRKQHLGTHRWLRYSSGEIPQLFLFFWLLSTNFLAKESAIERVCLNATLRSGTDR